MKIDKSILTYVGKYSPRHLDHGSIIEFPDGKEKTVTKLFFFKKTVPTYGLYSVREIRRYNVRSTWLAIQNIDNPEDRREVTLANVRKLATYVVEEF